MGIHHIAARDTATNVILIKTTTWALKNVGKNIIDTITIKLSKQEIHSDI